MPIPLKQKQASALLKDASVIVHVIWMMTQAHSSEQLKASASGRIPMTCSLDGFCYAPRVHLVVSNATNANVMLFRHCVRISGYPCNGPQFQLHMHQLD